MKCEKCGLDVVVVHHDKKSGDFLCNFCWEKPKERIVGTTWLPYVKHAVSNAHIRDIESRRVAEDGKGVTRFKNKRIFC